MITLTTFFSIIEVHQSSVPKAVIGEKLLGFLHDNHGSSISQEYTLAAWYDASIQS